MYEVSAICPQCRGTYGLELMFCLNCHARDERGNRVSQRLWIAEPIGNSGARKLHPPGSLNKQAIAEMRERNGNPKPFAAPNHDPDDAA
jgi:hypothetical protein